MKKNIIILLSVFILQALFLSMPVRSQDIDSCWCIPCYNTQYMEFYNRDTLAIDTCGIIEELGSSSELDNYNNDWCELVRSQESPIVRRLVWYKRYYSKRGWSFSFQVMAIDLPWAPHDSIVECSWEDIDSSYTNIRDAFERLEKKYGEFYFIKKDPEDTITYLSQTFKLRFDNWVNTIEVYDSLKTIPQIVPGVNVFHFVDGLSIDQTSEKIFEVYPNPSENKIIIKFNEEPENINIINIFSIDGNLQISQPIQFPADNIQVDISELSDGVYFVVYKNQRTKIVVRR